jgi:AGCS family alanine or glycine:cation symporter
MTKGVSRGIFSNEAGLGTGSIAHACADTEKPIQQGMFGIFEVFVDTIIICTLTALVVLLSGVEIVYGQAAGAELTMESFSLVFGNWIRLFITLSLCLFAFATVLGWGLYGARCAQYLFGHKVWKTFSILQAATVILGALLNTGTVWLMAEIVNGLMAIPNLIALTVLSPELSRLIIDFQKRTGNGAGGGTSCRYPSMQTAANPHLCGNSTPLRWQQRKRGRKYTT